MALPIRPEQLKFSCDSDINTQTGLDINTPDACSDRNPCVICGRPTNQFRDNHNELKYLESQSDVPESC